MGESATTSPSTLPPQHHNHPLIDPEKYVPDTLDFWADPPAQDYWKECFEKLVAKFAEQAVRSQNEDPTATERANAYQNQYRDETRMMANALPEQQNNVSNPFSIRTLLDLHQKCLAESGFDDPWQEVKREDNASALTQFKARLEEVDGIENESDKWTELLRGVFAGNVFDSGAQAVSELRAKNEGFGHTDALNRIQSRPWLFDDLDQWLDRLKGDSHKCGLIFVDNSGVDIVLGILPFVRQLLLRGTKVILGANRSPALNDITCSELRDLLNECRSLCPLISKSLDEQRLLVADNGQSGPCLDMRHLSNELEETIREQKVDLLVIEGMGRALHTNFLAEFRCETLKLAVVKNEWFAQRLGGENFSVICKFERGYCC